MSGIQNKKIEYSVFSISRKLFCLEISSVKEVLKLPRVTKLPNAAKHILGVYNLRGNIISLFDIQQVLGLDARKPDNGDMVLVVGEKNLSFSFVVEKVMDFIEIAQPKIKTLQHKGDFGETKFVSGIYQHESLGQIFLLDQHIILETDSFIEMNA